MRYGFPAVLAMVCAVCGGNAQAAWQMFHDLDLAAPIDRWDEAVPLGNGLLGGLLWGGEKTIKLSLDRGDLWDLRVPEMLQRKDWNYATLRALVAKRDQATMVEMFDDPYGKVPYATKIPAGRLVFTLDGKDAVSRFQLDLKSAMGRAVVGTGKVEVFYSACEPVAMACFPGKAQVALVPPMSLKKLDYAAPEQHAEGDYCWYLQKAALGLEYAVVVGKRESGEKTLFAITVTSTRDGANPVEIGKNRVAAALDAGFEKMLEAHAKWWDAFWAKSSVSVPDASVEGHYQLVQYFYGAASRRGAPPLPLQGVWTADEGDLPPWHGDYHHDLNTQMTYWAYLSSGHFDEGASFLDFMFNLLPEHRSFAADFYGAPGAAVPGVMTLDGKAMGGWAHYSLSPTQGAWVAHAFYLHWRYTMDAAYLKECAYPYCAAIAECLVGLMAKNEHGKLKLPLSTSPEIHDNTMKAWLTPNSNYDLALMRWLFGAVAEMAQANGDPAAAGKWKEILGQMDALAIEGDSGPLRLSADESLAESHRHFSHLMAIHPLGTLNVEGSDKDRAVIGASLKQLDAFGTAAWCGFSFSWRACLAARVGDADAALKYLKMFVDEYISRNGFHVNWPLARKGGHPFTLEANFAAAQAVHEMLLQSWGGVIRLFPAIPEEWKDVSFENLRAEGGYVVSAGRRDGKLVSAKITASCDGQLRVKEPVGAGGLVWSPAPVSKEGGILQWTVKVGNSVEFSVPL